MTSPEVDQPYEIERTAGEVPEVRLFERTEEGLDVSHALALDEGRQNVLFCFS